jgi:hypothetical protein
MCRKDCFVYLQSHVAECNGCRSSDSNRSISKLIGNGKTFVQVSEFDGRDGKISFLSDQIKFTCRTEVCFFSAAGWLAWLVWQRDRTASRIALRTALQEHDRNHTGTRTQKVHHPLAVLATLAAECQRQRNDQ